MKTATDEYWRVKSYLSGTINVEDGRIEPTKYGVKGIGPHIGIHYKPAGDGGESPTTDNERYDLAERIAGLLNNTAVERHRFVRIDDNNGSFNGIEFSAIGPHFDRRPPTCWWDQLETDEAKASRKFLMDQIVK
jgi:hypothetical protein